MVHEPPCSECDHVQGTCFGILSMKKCWECLRAKKSCSPPPRHPVATELNCVDLTRVRWPSVESEALSVPHAVVLRAATMRAMDRQPLKKSKSLILPGRRCASNVNLSMAKFFAFVDAIPKGEKVGEAIRRYVDSNQGTKYVEYFSD